MNERQEILALLESQKHGVISTVGADGQPHAATVAFAQTPDFELVIGTSDGSNKFANIARDNRIAFAASNGSAGIQYEGEARVVEGAEARECEEILIAKNPGSGRYAGQPGQYYLKIVPRRIRYTDTSHEPERTFEIAF